MRKFEDWKEKYENADEVVEFDSIPVGPQIVKILQVDDIVDREYLKVLVDIADGEYKNFFNEMYQKDSREDKKWPAQGTVYVSYKKPAEKFFAAFIKAVEKSNTKFAWDWNPGTLKGKFFVANYGEEEWLKENEDGTKEVATSIKVVERRSLRAFRDNQIDIPKKKELKNKPETKSKEQVETKNFDDIDEDLPF